MLGFCDNLPAIHKKTCSWFYAFAEDSSHHSFQMHGADEGLVVWQVLVDGDSNVFRRCPNEDEATVLGHLIGHRLGPFPGVVIGLSGDARFRVKREVHLTYCAVSLKGYDVLNFRSKDTVTPYSHKICQHILVILSYMCLRA